MLKVAVLQNEKNDFSEMLINSFRKADYHILFASQTEAYELEQESVKSVFIISADSMRYFAKIKPHIFVAAPNVKNYSNGEEVVCFSAVLCGEDASDVSKYIVSERIVTYGMSPKDTLTVSSAVDNVTIALQREIITLHDKTVEMQEISIPIKSHSNLNKLMAVSCVQILSGTPFNKIPELL